MFGSLKNYISGRNDFVIPMNQEKNIPDEMSSPTSSSFREELFYNNQSQARMGCDTSNNMEQSGKFSERLDRNLDSMADSLSRLKNLAIDLNVEIDDQNDLIDDITGKVEDTDIKIEKQNKQMYKILNSK